MCEKPLALTVEACRQIEAARDRAGRVLQVAYMKRYDPAYRRALELLPDSVEDVKLISVEVNDPDQEPFVAHLPMTVPDDLPAELLDAGEAEGGGAASAIRRCASPTTQGRARSAAASSPRSFMTSRSCTACWRTSAAKCRRRRRPAPFRRGPRRRACLRAARRRPRAHGRISTFRGVPDYRERITVYCTDRIVELDFPSPYLRHLPTRLTLRRRGEGHGARDRRIPAELRGGVPRGAARVPRRRDRPRAGADDRRAGAPRRRAADLRLQEGGGGGGMRIGVYSDSLPKLSRLALFAWCAERGVTDIELGVGAWGPWPRPHLDLATIGTAAERDRLKGELQEHGIRLGAVNAAGNLLHPDPAKRADAQARFKAAVALAVALGVEPRRHDERVPGRARRRRAQRLPVLGDLLRRREPLRMADAQRASARSGGRRATGWPRKRRASWSAWSCIRASTIFSAAGFEALAAHTGRNIGLNFDPSHFWWQGIDPVTLVEAFGDRIGWAHGKDTLLYPERIRRDGVLHFAPPADPSTRAVALRAGRGGARRRDVGGTDRRAARRRL